MVVFGTLLALGHQDNRGMMMSFAFLCQFGYGWALTLSFTFIQLGVDQIELGVAGALAYALRGLLTSRNICLLREGQPAAGQEAPLRPPYTQPS